MQIDLPRWFSSKLVHIVPHFYFICSCWFNKILIGTLVKVILFFNSLGKKLDGQITFTGWSRVKVRSLNGCEFGRQIRHACATPGVIFVGLDILLLLLKNKKIKNWLYALFCLWNEMKIQFTSMRTIHYRGQFRNFSVFQFSLWIYVKVSLLGVDSLWGDCTFILADWSP